MLDHVPASVARALNSAQMAELLDALWSASQTAKALALRDALAEGCIWDATAQQMREIGTPPALDTP